MADKPRFLLIEPTAFDVEYVINPWMEGNVHRVDRALARRQWEAFRDALTECADLRVFPAEPGLPDAVFACNGAAILNGRAVAARFRYPQRARELVFHETLLRQLGISAHRLPEGVYFEGFGDALPDRMRNVMWAGYGPRTGLEAHRLLARHLEIEVVSLRLVDERFYHLDTCFAPLSTGHVVYYPAAFDRASQQAIEQRIEEKFRIEVATGDAFRMACTGIEAGGKWFVHDCSAELEERIAATGLRVVRVDLSQFLLAGGSAHCLALPLDVELAALSAEAVAPAAEQIVRLSGHLIDREVMTRVLDTITEKGGSFEILEFHAGARREDSSHAQVRIAAPTSERLEELLATLIRLGAEVTTDEADARLEMVDMDGVAPEEFYGSTIFPTDIRVGGKWVRVEKQRMDAAIVVWEDAVMGRMRADCRLLRDLRVGDRVVVGVQGIRLKLRKHAADSREEFKFMASGVSSERRVELTIEQIAWEMTRIRERKGRIVVVAGPVVVHTGGSEALCELIRMGYVQVLLGGNAVAVHDIEHEMYGTSLGVDLARGVLVEGGHRHHLKAINRVRRAGGIEPAVRSGLIRAGIMKTLVECNIPYVLAGSIRDDGPLPDTVMDLLEAQRRYQESIRDAEMILLLSSMLHSIGTGNMTPAGVRLICVDINPAVVTKLADRGSMESVGVVTDVGLFLKLLVDKLKMLSA